jgi:hypothetical protein
MAESEGKIEESCVSGIILLMTAGSWHLSRSIPKLVERFRKARQPFKQKGDSGKQTLQISVL